MNERAFQRKLQAARVLGLNVVETYTKVKEEYFHRYEIKTANGEVIEDQSFPIDKAAIIADLEVARDNSATMTTEMQNKIDAIDALGD